jgi:hypothetical protein
MIDEQHTGLGALMGTFTEALPQVLRSNVSPRRCVTGKDQTPRAIVLERLHERVRDQDGEVEVG